MFLQRDVQNQILETAQPMFHQFGFNKVSIDQITNKIGISKKTLYKHYESKEALVLRIIEKNIRDAAQQMNRLHSSSKINYVEKMERLMSISMDFHLKFSEVFMQDIIKYMPDILSKFEESSRVLIRDNFAILLKQGIEAKVFRKDIDTNIFVDIYFYTIQKIQDPKTLSNVSYSLKDLHKQVINILFQGILTEEARNDR
ncbi:TetR/AcrR family transcriptional regulator [candidate division KSB1 bacterium]|nr:TetR/AcrR family transcriptional regulator [candidate division KSB1 bacterium]